MDMEIVQRFNAELSSLYEVRLPISKAKMSKITRISIMGSKMYKHIVQSVERFIHKCRPEYKLPALYVIDSIVRHSRHQFGADKDVYASRFTRNLPLTFQNLFMTCLPDDKPKIVRVLNLWQKNQVFSPDVIQPLLDLANPNAQLEQMRFQPPLPLSPNPGRNSSSSSGGNAAVNSMITSAASAANAVISLANNLNKNDNATLIGQLQQLANSLDLLKNEEAQIKQDNENILNMQNFSDVDYRNNNNNNNIFDEDNRSSTPTEAEPPYTKPPVTPAVSVPDLNSIASLVQNIFTDSDFLQQINTLQNNGGNASSEILNNVAQLSQLGESMQPFLNANVAALEQLVSNNSSSTLNNDHSSVQGNTVVPPVSYPFNNNSAGSYPQTNSSSESNNFNQSSVESQFNQIFQSQPSAPQLQQGQLQQQPPPASAPFKSEYPSEVPSQPVQQQQSSSDYYNSSSSASQSKRSRSDSNSGDHRSSRYSSRYSRGRSRDPDDSYQSSRDQDYRSSDNRNRSSYRDRSRSPSSRSSPRSVERTKQRERRRKGLPSMRKNYLTICSTTLWIGHVPKSANESDLSDVFGEYGGINSIDLIPSRGCAFVCMDRRQDAYKAYNKLKSSPKILNSNVKFAWAPGKGMKGKNYKDYWESDIGCSFIPYSVLDEEVDLDLLEEGGVIDDETIPESLKAAQKLQQKKKEEEAATAAIAASQVASTPIIPIQFSAPPMVSPSTALPPPLAIPPLQTHPPHGLPIPGAQFPFGAPPPPPPPVMPMILPPGSANSVLPPLPPPSLMSSNWTPIGSQANQLDQHRANPGNDVMTNPNERGLMDNSKNLMGMNNQNGSVEPLPPMNGPPFFPFPPPPPPNHPNSLPSMPPPVIPPGQPFFDTFNDRQMSPPRAFDLRPNADRNSKRNNNFAGFDGRGNNMNSHEPPGMPHNHHNLNNNLNQNHPHPNNMLPPPLNSKQLLPPHQLGLMNAPPNEPFFEDPFAPSLYELKSMERHPMNDPSGPPFPMGAPINPHNPPPHMPHQFDHVRFNRPPLLQNPSFMQPPPPLPHNLRHQHSHGAMHQGPPPPRFWPGRRNNNNNMNNNNPNNNFQNNFRNRGNNQRQSRWQPDNGNNYNNNNHNDRDESYDDNPFQDNYIGDEDNYRDDDYEMEMDNYHSMDSNHHSNHHNADNNDHFDDQSNRDDTFPDDSEAHPDQLPPSSETNDFNEESIQSNLKLTTTIEQCSNDNNNNSSSNSASCPPSDLPDSHDKQADSNKADNELVAPVTAAVAPVADAVSSAETVSTLS